MSLIIPNAADTTGGNKYQALDQAEPDALDFEILSVRGSGVVSGCAVTSNGTSNSVSVAGGTVMLNGTSYTLTANSSFGMPTAPTDNRFDIVVARVSGGSAVITAITGDDNATNPSYPKSASVITGSPSLTTNVNLDTDVVLAAVYRSGSSTITASRIVDKRATVTTSIPDQGASAPSSSYGSGTGSLFYKTGAPSGTASGVYVKTSTGDWIELAQNVGPHMPIGGACLWPSVGSVPSGFVEANGQLLSTSAYPALFAEYGYTHGGSGGVFGVPNYNNLFIRGTTNTSAVGVALGADSVTLSSANLPTHAHSMAHTHGFGHTHGIDHTHTGVTMDAQGNHTHDINHDHASFNTASTGNHTHTYNAFGESFVLNPEGTYLQFTSGFTANDKNWVKEGTTQGTGAHVHAIDVPSFTGTSSAGGSHQHSITVPTSSGLNTSSQSTSTTGAASSSDTGSVGSGTSFSVIPAAAQARWIIRASLGTDSSFTGGITGPWSASQTVTTVTGSGTYTLLSTDIGNLVVTTNGSAVTLSLTTGLDMVAGQRIDIIQSGAGQITVSGTGVTVNGTPGLKTRAQYSKASLICVAADTYILEGDIAA